MGATSSKKTKREKAEDKEKFVYNREACAYDAFGNIIYHGPHTKFNRDKEMRAFMDSESPEDDVIDIKIILSVWCLKSNNFS